MKSLCGRDALAKVRRVINATGVIMHTNLGRAPLSEAARHAVAVEAAGYCALEYDASIGSRGKRGGHVEELLMQLTGAEAALVVNNCAAAALLILTVLAAAGETLVSRGELVEIGGDFRVPEVMSNSGTSMVEVGSTNRTRLEDYKRAINLNTRLIMRVHPSNYRIIGFTDRMAELMKISDVFIGKPGGLTTSEALACGLPMVIVSPIPGQEERNSDFLLETGAAIKCNDLVLLTYKVDGLLEDSRRLRSMRSAAKSLGRPRAARVVADTLLSEEIEPMRLTARKQEEIAQVAAGGAIESG